jgi:hypothetical protein
MVFPLSPKKTRSDVNRGSNYTDKFSGKDITNTIGASNLILPDDALTSMGRVYLRYFLLSLLLLDLWDGKV